MSEIVTIPNVDHIQYRKDVKEESFDLLLEQFKGSENITKLTLVIAEMKQKLDDAVVSLGKLRLIDTASGAYLDEIGEQLGVPRLGATDSQYRIALKIRSYRSQTAGTRPQIIDLLSRFTGTPKTSISTYTGKNKSFDIAFYIGCLDIKSSVNELIKIFPILSSYRLVAKRGTPLGFTSVFNESQDIDGLMGLGSIFDSNNDLGGTGGHLGAFITATK